MVPVRFQFRLRAAQFLLVLFLIGLSFEVLWAQASDDYPHLRLGNPSQATANESEKDNFLMQKEFFALSYNNTKGTPNWVSWRLTAADLGNAPRRPFHPDSDLPRSFKRVVPADYTGSGFDRGHMCPHSDRSKNRASSEATFVMTNMVPQSPENNQKAWNQLELYCRDLVQKQGKVCYIIDGPAGKGGVGRNGFRSTTPNRQVVVPAKTWKVIMVLDADVNSPSQLTEDTSIRLIGVVVPNDDRVGFQWAGFRTSVKEIEDLTGYTFFDKVPAGVLEHLKEEPDRVLIPPPVPVQHNN